MCQTDIFIFSGHLAVNSNHNKIVISIQIYLYKAMESKAASSGQPARRNAPFPITPTVVSSFFPPFPNIISLNLPFYSAVPPFATLGSRTYVLSFQPLFLEGVEGARPRLVRCRGDCARHCLWSDRGHQAHSTLCERRVGCQAHTERDQTAETVRKTSKCEFIFVYAYCIW